MSNSKVSGCVSFSYGLPLSGGSERRCWDQLHRKSWDKWLQIKTSFPREEDIQLHLEVAKKCLLFVPHLHSLEQILHRNVLFTYHSSNKIIKKPHVRGMLSNKGRIYIYICIQDDNCFQMCRTIRKWDTHNIIIETKY